jgi:ankyrin repeat protein
VLSLDADPNERRGDGRTPLSLALGSLATVKLLLQEGADVNGRWCPSSLEDPATDPGCTVDKGVTPLMRAAQSGSTELVSLLLQFKADRSLRDWRGRTALHYATTRETYYLIKGSDSTERPGTRISKP